MHLPVVLFVSAALVLPAQNAREGPAALQGEWALVETADAKRVDAGADSIRMIVKDKTVTMVFAGLETNRATLTLGLARGTRTIDMSFANGRTILGVYELADGVLTICVAEAGNSRPGSLTPRGGQWQEIWRRVQP